MARPLLPRGPPDPHDAFLDHLAALREALPGLPLVAEFRNRGWFNERTYTRYANWE